MSYYVILGNAPELSVLELNQLGYQADWNGGAAASAAVCPEIERLGGVVKIAQGLTTLNRGLTATDELYTYLQTQAQSTGKLRFGFSVYAGDESITPQVVVHYAKKLRRLGIDLKKQLREAGHSARFVESKEPALSSVIVDKEGLLAAHSDLNCIITKNDIVVAYTTAVQDYKAYSHRDYGRPARDHHSGMLPPKIARMMVNITCGQAKNQTLLDPFCGSGTILQEAAVLGHRNLLGSDISKKAIADTKENMQWLVQQKLARGIEPKLFVCDAVKIVSVVKPQSVDCIVAEGYLGPVRPPKIDKVQRQMTKLYCEVIPELARIIKPGGRIVLAVPAWKRYDGILTMQLKNIFKGAHLTEFNEPIFYGRGEAKVIRQIYFLESNDQA